MTRGQRSRLDRFLLLLKAHRLPRPELEFRFAHPRRLRADYCWPTAKIIVEREGGIWQGGRAPRTAGLGHSAGRRILADMEKGNVAQILGFRYLRFTPEQLDSGEALPLIAQLLRLDRLEGSMNSREARDA